MTDLEILACLIASAVHDIGHPGINNHFHIAAKHELALLYNDRSVLENYHAAYAFRLIMKAENNILSELTQDEYNEARKLIIDLVLSTGTSIPYYVVMILISHILLFNYWYAQHCLHSII